MHRTGHIAAFVTVFSLAWSPAAFAQPPATTSPLLSAVKGALEPQFTPPPPGTYELPPIDTVADHTLLDSSDERVDLFDLTDSKIAVVSFMYTSCADVGGCPLAAAVLHRIDRMLSERPKISSKVTLMSVSFDPERDTPARMAEVKQAMRPKTDWRFLTSRTRADLQPVLDDFHQPVAKLWQEDGTWSGLFRHVLKVFLLDPDHNVRNIYSLGFFNPQLVLNDIETLLIEQNQQATRSP